MKRHHTRSPADEGPRITPEIAADAAVWIARLHGPERCKKMERECLAWQAISHAHREAFERCTDVWQEVPRIGLAAAYEAVASQGAEPARLLGRRHKAVPRWITASIVATMTATCAVFAVHQSGESTYSTKVGEQRQVVLEDGSRMLLNTDTQIQVDFTSAQRTVNISSGEALFEVAKNPRRPFIVRVAGSEVVAVGTTFAVRYAPDRSTTDELEVTLIEGKVNVRPAVDHRSTSIAPEQPVVMAAGERLRVDRPSHGVDAPEVVRVDRPDVDRLTAWKRSEAVFDDAPLADAVAEMNRYSQTPIVLRGGLESSNLRISGLYHVGDSAGFAHAVAVLHGLEVHEEAGRFELAKSQQLAPRHALTQIELK